MLPDFGLFYRVTAWHSEVACAYESLGCAVGMLKKDAEKHKDSRERHLRPLTGICEVALGTTQVLVATRCASMLMLMDLVMVKAHMCQCSSELLKGR